MALSPEFRAHALELLEGLGPVTARSMFGGAGLYLDGVMFALITRHDVLYFRTDDGNRGEYEAAGMGRFVTSRKAPMPYHQVPAELFEDAEGMGAWARRAWQAARRAKNRKKAR